MAAPRITTLCAATVWCLASACDTTSAADPGRNSGDTPGLAGADTDVGTDTDAATWDFTGFNNGVTLTGAEIVGGSEDNAVLHKVVPATVLSTAVPFDTQSVVISRVKSSGAMAFYAIAAVTNTATRPYCFGEVVNADYLDAAQAVVTTIGGWPINGSVGRSGTTLTATCLAPNEVGYFCDTQLDVDADLYPQVASVEFTFAVDEDTDLADPAARLVPQSYSFVAGDGLSVAVQNNGSAAATLPNAMTFYILRDTAGTPLWFHFLRTPNEEDLVVAPAGTATLVDPYIGFKGQGAKIQVFFDYGD